MQTLIIFIAYWIFGWIHLEVYRSVVNTNLALREYLRKRGGGE